VKGIGQEGLKATESAFRVVVSLALRIGLFIAAAHQGGDRISISQQAQGIPRSMGLQWVRA